MKIINPVNIFIVLTNYKYYYSRGYAELSSEMKNWFNTYNIEYDALYRLWPCNTYSDINELCYTIIIPEELSIIFHLIFSAEIIFNNSKN